MKVIAGRYTLALTAITCGFLLLIYIVFGVSIPSNMWIYSPGILVAFGLEILVLMVMYTGRGRMEVEIGAGNVILIVCVIAIFMIGTANIDIDAPLLDRLYELSYFVKQKI